MTPVDYVVIGAFMALMMAIGFKCKDSSANMSDYIRMGNKSTWWMAGLSIFMQGFSAITFTGICGQAFIAGWSVLIIFWCNAAMFLFQGLYVAPLMRRTRAVTPGDALRMRFGPKVEQVYMWVGVCSSMLWGGVMLLGFSVFAAALIDVPLYMIIMAIGLVVVFYSVSGGSWGVQITDSLQAIILLPTTVALALLCLHHAGGFDGLLLGIEAKGLTADFALIKSMEHVYTSELGLGKNLFTGFWMLAMLSNTFITAINLNTCHRFLSLKDEKSASKAAYLAAVLMLLGSLVWFIPPITARLFFEEAVLGVTGIANAADAAYAVVSQQMLPAGLMGLVFISMLSATMSSMDSFLTGTAGLVTNNIWPAIQNKFGWRERSASEMLSMTRKVNLTFGLWSMCLALILHWMGDNKGIFGILINIAVLVGAPSGIPIALALWIKRLPWWGVFVGTACGFLCSLTILILGKQGVSITWPEKVMWLSLTCLIPTLLTTFWYHTSSTEVIERTNAFYKTIKTPVDFEGEVGPAMDHTLLKLVGQLAIGVGSMILLLYPWADSAPQRMAILGIGLSIATLGLIMAYQSKRLAGVATLAKSNS